MNHENLIARNNQDYVENNLKKEKIFKGNWTSRECVKFCRTTDTKKLV